MRTTSRSSNAHLWRRRRPSLPAKSGVTLTEISSQVGPVHTNPGLAFSPALANRYSLPRTIGNIMISDSGSEPILMDLGSVAASPLSITSRSLAIATQDTAAEHSTMPYRAPELFDVKTGTVIDTKVDIWSMGCTLYACLVGKSPFELRSDETGGSLSICVLSGDWRFPDEGRAARRRIRVRLGHHPPLLAKGRVPPTTPRLASRSVTSSGGVCRSSRASDPTSTS